MDNFCDLNILTQFSFKIIIFEQDANFMNALKRKYKLTESRLIKMGRNIKYDNMWAINWAGSEKNLFV